MLIFILRDDKSKYSIILSCLPSLGALVLSHTSGVYIEYDVSRYFHEIVGFSFARDMILVSNFCAIILCRDMKYLGNIYEMPLLLNFASLGAILTIASCNMISLYLCMEVYGLSYCVLVAIGHKQNKFASEAGVKYFIISSFISAILLYGIALMFDATHSMRIVDIVNGDMANPILVIGLVMFIMCLLAKSAVAPLHIWAPDTYQGAPFPVTLSLMTSAKIPPIMVFLSIMGNTKSMPHIVESIIVACGIVSVLFGSIAACTQNKLKRMFTYGGIAHVGYIFVAIVAGISIEYVLMYLVIYITAMTGMSFILNYNDVNAEDANIVDVVNIKSLCSKFSGVILLLSLSGLPPLAGFFAKLQIFIAIVKSRYVYALLPMILASAISIYYYLKVIIQLIQNKETQFSVSYRDIVPIICAIMTLVFCLDPDILSILI